MFLSFYGTLSTGMQARRPALQGCTLPVSFQALAQMVPAGGSDQSSSTRLQTNPPEGGGAVSSKDEGVEEERFRPRGRQPRKGP